MKVLLVTSSVEDSNHERYENIKYVLNEIDHSHYPIGIAYLHAYVESKGIDIRSLFLNTYGYKLGFDEVIKNIEEYKPNIVGFQMLTQNRVSTYRLIEYIHENYPHIKIVAGGIHASVMYEQLLKKYPYLTIVIGEGEITFVAFIRAMEIGQGLDGIAGLAFNRDGQVIRTQDRPLITTLDDLPFPKHELYFGRKRDCACIITSRGCPFRCSFCALESITRRKCRTRSIANVMQEIEHLLRTFPQIKRIWIHDDAFFLDNERAIEFCDQAINRGWRKIPEFVASGRIKPISLELVKIMQKANFVMVLVGLESGTDEILERAHKGITQRDFIEAAKLFAKTKIDLAAFLIVGLPGETMDTIISTARFVQEVQKIKYLFYYDVGILMVYPGTEVYRLSKEAGTLTDDYWLTDKTTPFYTVDHTEKELFEFKKILMDHIALRRIRTLEGFRKQYMMLPYVVKFIVTRRGMAKKIRAVAPLLEMR